MLEKLREIMSLGKMAEIYTDTERPDVFCVGYIRSVNENQLLILSVGLSGEYDGYAVKYIEDVYRLSTDSWYLKKTGILAQQNFKTVTSLTFDGDFVYEMLEYSQNSGELLKLNTSPGDIRIYGYVRELNDDTVTLGIIDETYGRYDGETVILLDNIDSLSFGDSSCCNLDLLYRLTDDHGKEKR